MSSAMGSKEAQATLIDPFNEPEPAADTGLNSHFGSTFAGIDNTTSGPTHTATPNTSHVRNSSNPYRTTTPPTKAGASENTRPVGRSSPPTKFPAYREEALSSDRPRRSLDQPPPPAYSPKAGQSSSGAAQTRTRRTSSLRERFPGDKSHEPLNIIRRDSRKAARAPHLNKRHMPGTDTIDKLDPALGGRAYHHEGPYDAASFARNNDPKYAPVAALESTNAEALRATAPENIRDAVERHKPLDGVAVVPPGQTDRFGRTYEYEEGTDMMREGFNNEPGYKRWGGKDYDPEDLKGEGSPTFALDRALQAHRIDESTGAIEMQDHKNLNKKYHQAERDGSLDKRDPTYIAGDDSKYADLQHANDTDLHDANRHRSGSLREGIKKRIGSLRKRREDLNESPYKAGFE